MGEFLRVRFCAHRFPCGRVLVRSGVVEELEEIWKLILEFTCICEFLEDLSEEELDANVERTDHEERHDLHGDEVEHIECDSDLTDKAMCSS